MNKQRGTKIALALIASMVFLNAHAQKFDKSVIPFIKDSSVITALVDATVIDGTGGPSKNHQTIIINNGLITQLGLTSQVKIPENALQISCSGKTVIPGMVMLHEHFFYTIKMGTIFNGAEMPFSFPQMYLAGGATTIRTGGSVEPQTDLSIRSLVNNGMLIGPDIDVTGPYIERKGEWSIPSLLQIKDSAQASSLVRFWSDMGCTSFKMYVHSTKEDLIAVVREAHKRHLKVTGHIGNISYREAADLGIDNLEHGFLVSSDFDAVPKETEYDDSKSWQALGNLDVNSPDMKKLMQFLISKHVAITSTLPVFKPCTNSEVVLGGGDSAVLPSILNLLHLRWNRIIHEDSLEMVLFKKELIWEKQFYDAGGLLVCGTDPTGEGFTLAGYGSRAEIELLVEGGFSVVQAIQVATLNGAKYLEREKQIGSVEVGKKADLVLIDGNLESDIHNIRKTETVFKNGVGFDSKKIFKSLYYHVGMN